MSTNTIVNVLLSNGEIAEATPAQQENMAGVYLDGSYYWVVGESYGMFYPLTECCGASAKGSMGAVVCRACYAEIDPLMGISWTDKQKFIPVA